MDFYTALDAMNKGRRVTDGDRFFSKEFIQLSDTTSDESGDNYFCYCIFTPPEGWAHYMPSQSDFSKDYSLWEEQIPGDDEA